MLGIGSGSTIVHAVQRIGMVLGPTRCFVQDSGGGVIEEKEAAGTGWASAQLGASHVEPAVR